MNESMTLLTRGNPKVYVLILTTWNLDGDSIVVGVHSTRSSAEKAAAVLRTQKGTVGVDIEEHDLTP